MTKRVRTRFDQSAQIRERTKSGNMGNKGQGPKKKAPARAKDGTNRGRPKGAKNKPRDVNSAFGIDVNKFMRELRNHRKSNKLYQMTDELLASTIFANAAVIEEIVQEINENRVGLYNVDDMKGLLSAMKGSTAEVVSGIKALGLAAANRDPDIQGDGVMDTLTDLDLSKALPPTLQKEYVAAVEDIEKTEGRLSEEEKETEASLLQQIKQPIEAYRKQDDDPTRKKVLNPEQEGVGELD